METPVREKFLVFGAPDIQQSEIDEVVDSLRSGWIGTGPKVMQFERAFASYKGVKETQVSAVNSCTAALHLSLITAGIGSGDEVITTPMTFCATINSIIHCKATPVLADIDPLTMNIDPNQIKQKITDKTKAILVVHFAGRPCEMDMILEIAQQHGLIVIEDCAHAIETEYFGRKAGTIGDFGCFSFYVTKNVSAGEGGMIISKDEENASRSKILALHGMTKDAWRRYSDAGHKHYFVVESGFKYNMMDIQAALGIHQLSRVEKNWQRRRAIWYRYQEAFSDLPVGCPAPESPSTRHAYHLYTLMIEESKAGISRDGFLAEMIKNNVGVGVHYLSIPEHPFYQNRYSWQANDYPYAMVIGRNTVSLPLSPALSDADVDDVIRTVYKVLHKPF
jgi:dTDP-4-amino-4,6-dideoxygalactose transaminase